MNICTLGGAICGAPVAVYLATIIASVLITAIVVIVGLIVWSRIP